MFSQLYCIDWGAVYCSSPKCNHVWGGCDRVLREAAVQYKP